MVLDRIKFDTIYDRNIIILKLKGKLNPGVCNLRLIYGNMRLNKSSMSVLESSSFSYDAIRTNEIMSSAKRIVIQNLHTPCEFC